MSSYEAKIEARRERLQAAAERAQRESDARYSQARQMAEAIPFGQPMLVDHHSYKRDRNYRNRIHNNFGKAFEAADRAKELRMRAAAVGTGGISSEDPGAVAKIKAEIVELERKQEQMKAANAAIRKHAKAGAEAQVAALVELGFSEAYAAQLIKPDCCGRIGFADYQLQNNGANIRRLKARIPQVEALQSSEDVEEQIGAVTYREEEGRVQLVFKGKPADEIRAELRSRGFKWSPTRGAWVRQLSNAARYYGREIAAKVAA